MTTMKLYLNGFTPRFNKFKAKGNMDKSYEGYNLIKRTKIIGGNQATSTEHKMLFLMTFKVILN